MLKSTDQKFKKQVITEITIATIISSAINGIIGFLAVYFFKPVWDKIVSNWNKNEK